MGTDTDIDEQYKSDIDSNDPEIEMEEIAKYKKRNKRKKSKRKKSKHKLGDDSDKKKKKKKKKKLNNKIWQTIVLATSPTEDNQPMLFEEGPKYGDDEEDGGETVIELKGGKNGDN